jgi:hypothetical protein
MREIKIGMLTKSLLLNIVFTGTVVAGPIDLSTWLENGTGTWTLQAGNDAVKQSTNVHPPAVFHNGVNSQGQQLSGKVSVETTSDDDFFGFVLGYQNGDLSNGVADYLLIDWKQADQVYNPFGGLGSKGLTISRVTGALTSTDAWTHTGSVTELQRATNLGSTGWVDFTSYAFDIQFTASLVEVYVNGTKELSVAGSFNNGSFGFYDFSQTDTLYSALETSTIPVPTAMWFFGSALLGLVVLRKKPI